MASSVSSERAFSQAGITISSRRSRLKPDVVEALQTIKCALRKDLIFRTAASPSTVLEAQMEKAGADPTDTVEDKSPDDTAWDVALFDEDDEEIYEEPICS